MTNGCDLIAAERRRQIEKEGWTDEHDDAHAGPALVLAAICYAATAVDDLNICEVERNGEDVHIRDPWPWDETWDKRKKHARFRAKTEERRNAGRVKCLTIAGALIAAEIDRLQRAAPSPDEGAGVADAGASGDE